MQTCRKNCFHCSLDIHLIINSDFSLSEHVKKTILLKINCVKTWLISQTVNTIQNKIFQVIKTFFHRFLYILSKSKMSTPVQQTPNSVKSAEAHKKDRDVFANNFVDKYYQWLENKPEALHGLVWFLLDIWKKKYALISSFYGLKAYFTSFSKGYEYFVDF